MRPVNVTFLGRTALSILVPVAFTIGFLSSGAWGQAVAEPGRTQARAKAAKSAKSARPAASPARKNAAAAKIAKPKAKPKAVRKLKPARKAPKAAQKRRAQPAPPRPAAPSAAAPVTPGKPQAATPRPREPAPPEVAAPKAAAPEVRISQPLNRLEAAARYREAWELERQGDLRGAFKAYQQAAEGGHGPAQKKLGDLYGTGNEVVERDYETSLRWYTKAREQGIHIPKPFSYPGVRR